MLPRLVSSRETGGGGAERCVGTRFDGRLSRRERRWDTAVCQLEAMPADVWFHDEPGRTWLMAGTRRILVVMTGGTLVYVTYCTWYMLDVVQMVHVKHGTWYTQYKLHMVHFTHLFRYITLVH